ncbi:hypothetical protein FNV43_RR03069 [Rhamnella rubrinervis]|uniref:non-specific serine/threonine protein kinase n=1 Tax=Rhamnella rubrinervis TaxID=2594499 RepID=A0A8K0HHP2_9ROSA|nr:hypothetical protein FNV43_RR03069 [Rhamnella rubrinervis]
MRQRWECDRKRRSWDRIPWKNAQWGRNSGEETRRIWTREQPRPWFQSRDTNTRQHQAQKHSEIASVLLKQGNESAGVRVHEEWKLGRGIAREKGAFLGWNLRYKIATEAAKGLCYLHHDCSPLIVHRDVKSNNILLNSSFEAHVADFGLAKFLFDGGASECMSAIAGSYGYIAPEYAYTLRVDEKSDVYSYGVVLLELVTGRRPVGWCKKATNCRKEGVVDIVDPRLQLSSSKDESMAMVMHLFFIAMLCIQDNSVERPTMREVVQMLSEFSSSSMASSQQQQQQSPHTTTTTTHSSSTNFKQDLLQMV